MEIQCSNVPDRISELRKDHGELIRFLKKEGKITLLTRAEDAFRKTLIVAVASHFEKQLAEAVVDIYFNRTQGSMALATFVRKQAFGRRYSQHFSWEGKNANSFFSQFGNDFRDHMKRKFQDDQVLKDAVRAFLKLGDLRNNMVHDNFADFQPNITADEVYELYLSAKQFVDLVPEAILEFIGRCEPQIRS